MREMGRMSREELKDSMWMSDARENVLQRWMVTGL